jgi:hypothetical protein
MEGVSCCPECLHIFNIFAATSRAEGMKICDSCKDILMVTAWVVLLLRLHELPLSKV